MQITEIFESISGEVNGHHQGRICTFLRTSGCNLSCTYCFGVVPGQKIPKLITSRIPNLKLPEVYPGLKLMTFDSAMNLVETTVTNVKPREVRKWYKITIEGVQYFVTPEHPFFTNRGLINTEDLKVGDEILHAKPDDKLSFRMSGALHPMKDVEVVRKSTINTNSNYVMGKKVSTTIRKKQEEGLYINPWHSLTENKQDEMKRRLKSTGRNGMKVEAIKYFDIDKLAPSIKSKPLKVYAISCSPYNSYLLDYMWVHNCDTPETQNLTNGSNLKQDSIIEKIMELEHKYICITGGEPLLQKNEIISLLEKLYYYDFLISVETNGTIDISPFFRYVDSFVIDFKLNLKYYFPFFKNYLNLRNKDVIKFVVGSEKEFVEATNNYSFLENHYKHKKEKPIIAFSPIISKTFTPKILFNLLKTYKIHNSLISLQMHKFAGFN